MTYPSTNLNEAVGLIVPDSNALHDIINGDAESTIVTPKGREVPTVLKAMADSLLFKDPIPWEEGGLEQDPLQLRTFTDGLIYWAPTAQLTNPVAMGVSPSGDSNWKISPIIKTHNSLTNRDEAGAHPASAIITSNGDSVQEFADDFLSGLAYDDISRLTGEDNSVAACFSAIREMLNNYGTATISKTYYLYESDGFDLSGVSGIIKGVGNAAHIEVERLLGIKSAENVTFKNVNFKGADYSDSNALNAVWCSNYKSLKFLGCIFRGFGGIDYPRQGSTQLYLVAQATTSSPTVTAVGDSSDGLVDDCDFISTWDRSTSFGVRVFTPFEAQSATNKRTVVRNSRFYGINWDAVELAGLGTINCEAYNNTAYDGGLGQFNIDKGARECRIYDCTQIGMRGNRDIVENPNTYATAFSCQGVSPDGGYARGNSILNCKLIMKLSDLSEYPNNASIVGQSFGVDNTIRGIQCTVEATQAEVDAYINSGKKFFINAFDTITSCTTEDIKTNFATHGIYQFQPTNAAMDAEGENVWEEIRCSTPLVGEVVSITKGGSNKPRIARFKFKKIKCDSLMTNPISSVASPVPFDLQYTGSGTFGFRLFDVTGAWSATYAVRVKTANFCIRSFNSVGETPLTANLISPDSIISNVALDETALQFGNNEYNITGLSAVIASSNTNLWKHINSAYRGVSGRIDAASSSVDTESPLSIASGNIKGMLKVRKIGVPLIKDGSNYLGWSNSGFGWGLTDKQY